MGAMTFIGDRLANVLSGLGGLRDKTAANSWGFAELSREQLSNAYRGDGLSRTPGRRGPVVRRRWERLPFGSDPRPD